MYLYLLAPVSLAFLNPIGFVLMEIGKSTTSNVELPRIKIALKAMQGIVKNPIVMMTFLGILGNLVFHSSMPEVIHNFMATLGSAFSASALFLLGLRMVGQGGGKQSGAAAATSLITPFILVTMKSLVLPVIAREIVSQLGAGRDANETLDLSNYAFLYGTIPTAPSVFVYATNYDVVPDMVARTLTASTFIAAPLMFVTAKLLTLMNMNPADYVAQLDGFLLDVSVVGLLAAGWAVFVLLVSGRARRMPHYVTALLGGFQGLACLGALLWSLMDCTAGPALYIQFVVFGLGVFGSRVCTGALAGCLLVLQVRGECELARHRTRVTALCLGLPGVLTAALTAHLALETPAEPGREAPSLQYGTTQAVVALTVILLSLSATILCMILGQRYGGKPGLPGPAPPADENTSLLSEEDESLQETSVEIEDLVLGGAGSGEGEETGSGCQSRCRLDSEHRQYCSGLIRRYQVPPGEEALSPELGLGSADVGDLQLLRHNLLLLALCISMFVGAALCIWTLVMDQFSGIYLELVFLDGFLNLGQSIFTFALFGVNARGIAIRLRRAARRAVYGREELLLPGWEDLDHTTRAVSTMFIKHHLAACMSDLGGARAGTSGTALVSWLLERGLVLSRQDGQAFGRHLLRGRVIRHVDNHLDFYDDRYLYTFQPGARA